MSSVIRLWLDSLLEGYYGNDNNPYDKEYRAWILPDGTHINVADDETHAECAFKNIGYEIKEQDNDDPDFLDIYDYANKAAVQKEGWIRLAVTSDNSLFVAELSSALITKESKNKLIKIINNNLCKEYNLAVDDNFSKFDNSKEAIFFLNKINNR